MRVLAVCPRFPPTNAADSHRLRLLLPHFAAEGCEVEVLCVDARDVHDPVDAWLAEKLPPSVAIHRIRAGPRLGWGWNGLAQRSFHALYRKGNHLMRHGQFDLVFFSTTEFLVHVLGPLWRAKWGIPFCMDYQDPWTNDYYARHPHVVPPGGRLKYAIISKVHAAAERAVVSRCGGFLSVSAAYRTMLERRFGRLLADKPWLIAGFPGEPAESADSQFTALPAQARESRSTWRYVGRGGADLSIAIAGFFQAWRNATDRGLLREHEVRFEAIGTSYAAPGHGEMTIEPLAGRFGLGPVVSERPDRIGYRDTLRALASSDALVVFGSDDPAYTASKIYPYLLAGKPVLAIFHERSPVVQLIRAAGGAVCVTFDETTSPGELSARIERDWFGTRGFERPVALDAVAFRPFTAATQARDVVAWFRRVLESAV